MAKGYSGGTRSEVAAYSKGGEGYGTAYSVRTSGGLTRGKGGGKEETAVAAKGEWVLRWGAGEKRRST